MVSQSRVIAAALASADGLDAATLEALRRRMQWVLFGGAALASTGYIAAVTVGTLVAAELGGSARLAGMPSAAAVFGTAAAASVLSASMLRLGRRRGLVIGFLVALVGATLALGAVVLGSIVLLLVGSALTGFATGSANLGRYVAGDLVPPERRASAIGMVVWGSTIGAVTGPNLVAPGGALAVALGMPKLAGAYLLTVACIGLACVLMVAALRPEPYALAHRSALERKEVSPAPVRAILRRRSVVVALGTLIMGQAVMAFIMTMTPIHLTEQGHGLATVGLVLSAHTFGMFALSPVSGRLSDRFGRPLVIGAGLVTLAAGALLAAVAPTDGGPTLAAALFLLGFGWNLGFVAGSAMLTEGLSLGERTRTQGVADTVIWSSAALASLLSGVVVVAASYTALGMLAAFLALVALVVLAASRRPRAMAAAG